VVDTVAGVVDIVTGVADTIAGVVDTVTGVADSVAGDSTTAGSLVPIGQSVENDSNEGCTEDRETLCEARQ
jgi:hypothetical protein